MKHYLLLLFLATGLCACVDENSNLGHTLVNSSFYNVYVDTCTVDISTVLEDSIVTRGDSICQIGHYLDETWGEVTATYIRNTLRSASRLKKPTVTHWTHWYS